MSPGGLERVRGRPATFWVVLAMALLLAALATGLGGRRPTDGAPLDPRSTGPLGTRALVLLLEDLGAEVELRSGVPAPADEVALVLADRLDDDARAELSGWVGGGGTLVVADPASPLHPFEVDEAAVPETSLERACAVPALAGVDDVDPAGGVAFTVPDGTTGCFPPGEDAAGSAFVVVSGLRRGTLVAMGGAGAFTNEAIGSENNAVLAASLLAPRPGTRVALLQPRGPGEGPEGLADLVGDNVKGALAQLGVAFALYAWWRGRRLGSPVTEVQPVRLEASELVVAVGNMLQHADRHDHAADLLRDDLRRTLASRLGLSAATPAATVAEVAAERTGVPVSRLRAVLEPTGGDGPAGPGRRGDQGAEELVALAAAADGLRREVAGAR